MTQPILDYYDLGVGVVAFSSTRLGGCGTGAYSEFNINPYCGDNDAHIRQNRASLCRMLAIDDNRLILPHQVHLAKVVKVDAQLLSLSSEERKVVLEGFDALMTDVCGVCIGVSTADCIPVLLHDPEHHAVCAVHAGWRGTVQRIVSHAVQSMTDAFGTHPEHLSAQIGPGISLDSFEVGDEVYKAFSLAGFHMDAISRRENKWHIDLPACNLLQLLEAGVPRQSVAVSNVCTFRDYQRYFSARRLGVHSGRIFTGVMMKAFSSGRPEEKRMIR